MKKYINLNELVAVELTDEGLEIWRKWWRGALAPNLPSFSDYSASHLVDNGVCKFQLWELMNIFGMHCFMGNKTMFKNNSILIGA